MASWLWPTDSDTPNLESRDAISPKNPRNHFVIQRHSKLCKSSGFLDAIDVDAEDDPISVDVEDTNVADVDYPVVEEVNWN